MIALRAVGEVDWEPEKKVETASRLTLLVTWLYYLVTENSKSFYSCK